MDAATAVRLILSLALLLVGAEALIRGSSGIAARAGISPLVVGLTVVAVGTSSPEMAVSLSAALKGNSDLAVGNVVGSNIFNLLFILGACAAISPLLVARQLLRVDVPVMIGASVIALLFGLDGRISRVEGALLFIGLLAYTAVLIHLGRKAPRDDQEAATPSRDPLPLQILLVVGGLMLLILGSRWFVAGAVRIATLLGMSELVIGLTIVAIGTALPEVASSAMATYRGHRDLAVGNVIGSNVFNLLGVLGVSAAAAPHGVIVTRPALTFDLPIMIAASLICLPIFFTGRRVARREGWLFLLYYASYTVFLVLDARNHPSAAPFGSVLVRFAIPVTVLFVVIGSLRTWRAGRPGGSTS